MGFDTTEINLAIFLLQVLLVTVLVLAIRQWGEIKEFSVHFASKVKNNTEKEKLRDL